MKKLKSIVINKQNDIMESCSSLLKRNVISNKLTAWHISQSIYLTYFFWVATYLEKWYYKQQTFNERMVRF